jgi:AcrR family transcriptional regulator
MTAAPKTAVRRGDPQAGAGRSLQPIDWVVAGITLLSRGGVDAVRITHLADALEVTRGSFYWHFKDRQALLDALVDFWRDRYTGALVATAEGAQTLSEGILGLFDVWIGLEEFDPRVDAAMRDWARVSDTAGAAVEAADKARLDAIAALFFRNGYERTEASLRARVVYYTQIGYYALGIEERMADRLDLLELYYATFTGRTLDPVAADRFRARHLGHQTSL